MTQKYPIVGRWDSRSDSSHGDHRSSLQLLGSDVYLFSLQRQAKYSENKLKCTKARNDYLLNLAATNAAISKYYIHDVSDLIDVSNLGCWVGLHAG